MDGTSGTLSEEEVLRLLDRLDGLTQVIPNDLIEQVVRETDGVSTRACKLNSGTMLWVVLAMGIFTTYSIRNVFRSCVRFEVGDQTPTRSAFCKARQRLGIEPLRSLFRKVVKLQCRSDIPGGFYKGFLLMGVDGVQFTCPFTPANVNAFGLPKGGHTAGSKGGFPLVGKVSLVELGSHVEFAFVARSQDQGESTLARRLVKSMSLGMLILLDAGFFGYLLLRSIIESGAQFLVNVSSTPLLKPFEILSDKSYLAKIYACTRDRERDHNGIVVRVVEYTLDDPQRPRSGETRRLVTTLLDPIQHPAEEIIVLYHERWEHEGVNDEQKTHQDPRRSGKATHLRSETPGGVMQELYALSLAHYVVRKAMFDTAVKCQIDPDRLSFTASFQILQIRLPDCPANARPSVIQKWYNNLLAEISSERVEPRRNRINPRVIKRARVKWKSKKPADYRRPKLTKTFRQAILIS